jgi:hypothetical protein
MSSIETLKLARQPSSDALFALAVEAVQFTLPLYEMARMRAAMCPRIDHAGRPAGESPESTLRWANHWIHTRKLLGPNDRQVVTPNNDTLYSSTWLDLSRGPLLLHVPAMGQRYYVLGLLDMYTNPFGYIGTRTTGSEAATFLLHGPDWRGDVPPGVQAMSCLTASVWLIGRILVDGEHDLAAASALQDQFKLAAAPGSDAQVPCRLDAGMQPQERMADPVRYAQIVNRVLLDDPPPADERGDIARFAACGIGADCLDAVMSAAQCEVLERAIRHVTATLAQAQPSDLGGGWALPVEVSESFGRDYRTRAQVALNYIGALGIEEAMYIVAEHDADGMLLDGSQSYMLRFGPDALLQTGAFWSLTAYEKATCLLAPNAIGRYSIGDRTQGLRHDEDGGLTLVISAHEPADPVLRQNWLPAPPERFYLALRLYVPGAVHLTRTFRYPTIERQPR